VIVAAGGYDKFWPKHVGEELSVPIVHGVSMPVSPPQVGVLWGEEGLPVPEHIALLGFRHMHALCRHQVNTF